MCDFGRHVSDFGPYILGFRAFRAFGYGFRVGPGFGIKGTVCRAYVLGFRVQGSR